MVLVKVGHGDRFGIGEVGRLEVPDKAFEMGHTSTRQDPLLHTCVYSVEHTIILLLLPNSDSVLSSMSWVCSGAQPVGQEDGELA